MHAKIKDYQGHSLLPARSLRYRCAQCMHDHAWHRIDSLFCLRKGTDEILVLYIKIVPCVKNVTQRTVNIHVQLPMRFLLLHENHQPRVYRNTYLAACNRGYSFSPTYYVIVFVLFAFRWNNSLISSLPVPFQRHKKGVVSCIHCMYFHNYAVKRLLVATLRQSRLLSPYTSSVTPSVWVCTYRTVCLPSPKTP